MPVHSRDGSGASVVLRASYAGMTPENLIQGVKREG